MRNSTMIRHALLATTLLGAHSIANARPAPTTNPPAAVEAQANQNEIIITAQKRSEKLQNVPIQVDVLTGKKTETKVVKCQPNDPCPARQHITQKIVLPHP